MLNSKTFFPSLQRRSLYAVISVVKQKSPPGISRRAFDEFNLLKLPALFPFLAESGVPVVVSAAIEAFLFLRARFVDHDTAAAHFRSIEFLDCFGRLFLGGHFH